MYLKEKPTSTTCVIEFSKMEKLTSRKGFCVFFQ